ncbi:MAG TPA: EAL domain-containing protein [Thermoanaerobaculia bacterium]|nr:EAL domain-containing protein [Thermoanaerobaculia bacterium]
MTIAILRAQQEATLDGILVISADRRVVSYNHRFLELWHIPPEVAERGDDAQLLERAFSLLSDPEVFMAGVQELYDHPTEVRTDDQINLIDGRTLSRATVPVISEDGTIDGRAWYFRDITESRKMATLQSAIYRIADLARSAEDLKQLYHAIHNVVGELMDVTNFYIALYDAKRNELTFEYFVDRYDVYPEGNVPIGRGLTEYVIRTGQSLLVDPQKFDEMLAAGEVDRVGAPSVDWLGVPLKSGDKTLGVMVVQSYDEATRFGPEEQELLEYVSQQIASAIEHKQKESQLRESENWYRQMFQNNSAIKLVVDPATAQVVDANQAATEFYGYSIDEIRSKRIFDINVGTEQEIRDRMCEASEQHVTIPHFRHRLKNGDVRDVEVHTGPIEVQGKRLLYSIVHDITVRKRAESALLESEEKYRNIFDYASIGIYQSTPAGQFITANTKLARMLGYDSLDELLGKDLNEIYFDPQERKELIAKYEPIGSAIGREVRWKRKDGSIIWVQLNAHALKDAAGTSMYFEGFVDDITDKISAEETMRIQSVAMEASMDGIAIVNPEGLFTYLNAAFLRLYGYGSDSELMGRHWRMLYNRKEFSRFMRDVFPSFSRRGEWRGEGLGRRKNGASFPQELSLTRIENGDMLCVARDITERTYAEEQIKHLAYHDALTGLPNRLLFKDRLTVALSHAQRANRKLSVLFLDLDRFKVINDSLGHNAGDLFLQNVAQRIQACIRESDTVARLGGDEFTLLLPMLAHAGDAARIAQKILDAIRAPFYIDNRELYATTSIGISIFPEDGVDADTLIKNADTAMYLAKELGRNKYQLFNAAINAKALERLALENGLRKAITNREFRLHYQPIFDIQSGRVHGCEALIRWQHPELGLVLPNHFIPLAEGTGLMVPIGTWVLEEACRQTRQWQDKGFKNLSVAVNLSVSQLQQGDLCETVKEVLADTGLSSRFLELEITESSAMQNPELIMQTLVELKRSGVRISLDDFGIGHSSLSYLKRFPIDTLKIDQSFVRDIIIDPDTAAIVMAIIAMAHKLRMNVIAEGVEQESQRAFLCEHQCDQLQGFLMRGPLESEAFEKMLHDHNETANQWQSVARQ